MKLLTCCLDNKKYESWQVCGSECPVHMERCHRTKMNKPDIRELIILRWVYPGVGRLCGSPEGQF